MRRTAAILLAPFVVLASCGGGSGDGSRAGDEATGRRESPAAPGASGQGVSGTAAELCQAAVRDPDDTRLAAPGLVETSGVVASRRRPGVLWAHNDSGSPAELFAVGEDGGDRGRIAVEGAGAVDWEDIALGAGPGDDVDHLYIGDLGDNTDQPLRLDDPMRIVRVPEPDVPAGDGSDGAGAVEAGATAPAVEVEVAYEDGPRDAEALMADPSTGDLFIVSKQWDGTAAGVYRVPAEVAGAVAPPTDPVTLARVADVPGTEGVWVTGGDISADGRLIALRSYAEVWLWDRSEGADVGRTLARPPACRRRVDEPQGEAVAFAPDGRGFVTISEGAHVPVQWHRLP